jgi:UDP-N-acetylglucosamine/UDP-N-acetylgalactosamine diphosphorylase
MTSRLNDS